MKPLISTTIPGQSGPGSNGNEWVHIPQSSKTGASPSDSFELYPLHLLVSGVKMQKHSQHILQLQPTGLKKNWIMVSP